MLSIFEFVFHIFLAICAVFLLIFSAITIYIKLLNNKHYLYSFLLLLYPFTFFVIGILLIDHGSTLNQEELNSLSESGDNFHALSVDAGIPFILWGYGSWGAALILIFVVLFLIILRLIRSYKNN